MIALDAILGKIIQESGSDIYILPGSPVRAKVHPRVLKVLAPKLSREEEGGRCVGV